MPKINLLDSSIYNLIAAGEVVERPASIIKELVENSIDANSSTITVEIFGGGIEKLIVTDNGVGIEKNELKKAFMPHATSKISSKEDLAKIFTLGFRGEALPSISAVSKVKILSKPQEQDVCYCLLATANEISEPEICAGNNGTSVIVSDVFYNVPARAKFLKKAKQEENEITSLMAKFILTNPTIAFRYLADGKMVNQSTGLGISDALFCVYGKTAINETLPVNYSSEFCKITGVLGKPSLNKPNRTYQTIIVNGRFVNNQQISFAVSNALEGYLMKRQYPFFVYYFDIPTDLVDVNVHPNKLEVRFSNEHEIYNAVYNATINAISQLDSINEVKVLKEKMEDINYISPSEASLISNSLEGFNKTDDLVVESNEVMPNLVEQDSLDLDNLNNQTNPELSGPGNNKQVDVMKDQYIDSIIAYKTEDNILVADGFGLGSSLLNKLESLENEPKEDEQKVNSKSSQIDLNLESMPAIKMVGKVFNTYLILEDAANVYFIDQHAAHERLLYEKFKAEFEAGKLATQPLLAPYIFTVNASEKEILKNHLTNLIDLGFNITEFGAFAFQVDEIPLVLADLNFNEFFAKFLDESKNNANFNRFDLVRDEIMQLSCKSAIKGGEDLTNDEINHLYLSLGKEKIALFCPHGRPIVIRISKNEMDKWFKRIV